MYPDIGGWIPAIPAGMTQQGLNSYGDLQSCRIVPLCQMSPKRVKLGRVTEIMCDA